MIIFFQKSKAVLFIILLMITMSTSKVFSQSNDSIPPLSFAQLYEQGKDYFDKEEYISSLNYLQQAAVKNLNYSPLATYLGIACKNLNLYGSAIAYFEAALNIGYTKRSLGNLGALYGDLGQYNISFEYLDKALAIDPYYPYALNNKGSMLFELGKFDEALETLNQSVDNTDLPLAQSFSNIGEVYQKMGQSENAILYFDKALYVDSTFTEAMLLKVKELKRLGKTEKDYKSLCEQVIKIESNTIEKNPEAYKSLFFRASAYKYLSDDDLMDDDLYYVLDIINNLIPLYPKASSLFEWKAKVYAMLGDTELARENYQIVLNLEPEVISAKEYIANN